MSDTAWICLTVIIAVCGMVSVVFLLRKRSRLP